MQIDDLVRLYQSKSDGELLQLAGQADQLTPEAHSQLSAELFRGRIPFPSKTSVDENLSEKGDAGRIWLSRESIDDLTRLYQSKSDDELMQLAAQSEQLTPEAHTQLSAKLFRRRIPFPSKTSTDGDRVGLVEAQPTIGKHWSVKHSSEFIAEVLRLYHRNLWTFIKFVAPAVLVGSFAVILGRKINLQIVDGVFRRGASQYRIELVEMQLVHLAALFTSWIVFSIAFAATCSAVHQLEAGSPVSPKDCLLDVFARLGRLLGVCTFLGFLCMFIFAVTAVGVGALVWRTPVRHLHLSSSYFVVSLMVSWVLLVLLSRFALAVPAVVLDGYKVGQSLFRSDELTEGRWPILAALVCKSYIGGYIAGLAPYWAARWIPESVPLPSWFSWCLYAASAAAVTLVEPPMFIGFALLYLKQSAVLPSKTPKSVGASIGMSSVETF